VKANEGSPGIDGMTVEQLPGHLKEHWPVIREQLLSGTYQAEGYRWLVDLDLDLEKFLDLSP
jgi:RNA-directed DNA polymerase